VFDKESSGKKTNWKLEMSFFWRIALSFRNLLIIVQGHSLTENEKKWDSMRLGKTCSGDGCRKKNFFFFFSKNHSLLQWSEVPKRNWIIPLKM